MPNRIDDPDIDTRNSPAASLSAAEKARQTSILDQLGADLREDDSPKGQQLRDTADEMERQAGNFETDVSGHKKRSPRLRFNLRKAGPAIGVGGIVIGLVTALAGSFSLSTMVINIKELAMERWDTRSVSSEVRSSKLLTKRLGESTTKGCAVVKLACKYQTPSNKFLKNLASANIVALDVDGNTIDKQSWIDGKKRPASYKLPDGEIITAKNFSSVMDSNPTARAAFRKAHNPRWVSWTDSISTKTLRSLGWSSKRVPTSIGDSVDTKTATKAAGEISGGDAISGSSLDSKISSEVDNFVEKNKKKLVKGLGNGVSPTAVATFMCVGTSIPGVVVKVVRSAQVIQLAKYAMIFLTVADAIKAGEATAAEVSAVGSILTQVVSGKSAMDSFGMRNLLFGDTSTKGDSYKKFVPGGNLNLLTELSNARNNESIKGLCNAAMSPEAQVAETAIKAAKATNPAGWGLLAVDTAFWIAAETGLLDNVVGWVLENATSALISILPMEDIIKSVAGDLTSNLEGTDAGDGSISGINAVLSNVSNAGGNGAMNREQTIGYYEDVMKPVQLAWAEEDRATLSPLDTSSPYTMLGSITRKFTPYATQMSSVVGQLSSVVKVARNSAMTLVGGSVSASSSTINPDEFDICPDPIIQNSGIASSPWCNPYYGIPSEYIEIDPDDVLISLQDQLDDEGNPKPDSELSEWIADCNSNDTTTLSSCVIDSQEKANYSLYQIDKWIVEAMDEEIPDVSSEVTSSTAVAQEGDIAWPLNKELYSSKKSVFLKGHGLGSGTFVKPGGRTGKAADLGASSLGVSEQEPIYAVLGGSVVRVGGGHAIIIRSPVPGGTVDIAYAHGYVKVKEGDSVVVGQQISGIGDFGNSNGAHLHIDMNFNQQQFCPQDLFIFMDSNPGKIPDFGNLVSKASSGGCSRL